MNAQWNGNGYDFIIFGSTGFIGRALKFYLSRKYRVLGLSRSDGVNLLDPYIVQQLLVYLDGYQGCLINACGIVPNSSNHIDNSIIMYKNMQIDRNISLLHSATNASYVYISGTSLYSSKDAMLTEDDQLSNFSHSYLAAKKLGEEEAIKLSKTAVVRIPSPIGIVLNEKTVIGKMISDAYHKKVITFWGDGSRSQNFIDCKDISRMIDLICSKQKFHIYNCTSKCSITMKDLAKQIRDLINKDIVIEDDPTKLDEISRPCQEFSSQRALEVLGWQQHVMLDQSLRRFLK